MTRFVTRRQALATGAAFGLAAQGLASSANAQATRSPAGAVAEESAAIEALYQQAQAEGGKLVVYAGGDTATQQDGTKKAFLDKFPKLDLQIVVDYSKFHDVRFDNQRATAGAVPDVIQLQTLQNYPRWKQDGALSHFKPAGFAHIHPMFKDADGAWMAIGVIAFSYMVDTSVVGDKIPASVNALSQPEWRGTIASTYPHDDDAALFLYKRYVETYGWSWLAAMARQDIQFARGSHTPGLAVNQHQKAIGMAGSGSLLAPATNPVKWMVPDEQPFLAWGQRAAIVKGAKNLAAAKLYMSWQVSAERQLAAFNGWSIRTDVQPKGNLKPVYDNPNGNVAEFVRFMEDRALTERWRQTFAIYFGEVKGEPSPGWLGLRPGA